MATPTENVVIHNAIAKVRCWSLRNIVRMSAKVEGIKVAPATPSAARAAMNISGVVDRAAQTDAAMKATEPTSSSRRRPMRSPIPPIVTNSPAIMNP